ncbi:MAG: flagellar basal body-associated FliL family protein [Paracoccaceae bacterium]|nr:flagellar basal body-associated FliL family protein [Paracoccaceae bacterium]
MADAEEPQDAAPKKKSKLPLIIGVFLAMTLGGGGFFAAYTGLILGHGGDQHATEPAVGPLPDIAFVPVDAVVISLGAAAHNTHLRMTSQLEVAKPYSAEVTLLMPRILDVVNGYLRAIEVSQLEDPTALVRLRAQMLRRIQIVTGEGRVRDLLITEFVLN